MKFVLTIVAVKLYGEGDGENEVGIISKSSKKLKICMKVKKS